MAILIELIKESFTNEEMRKCIRSSDLIVEFSEQNANGFIDKTLIATLKPFYEGLDLEQLLLLWHENYNSIRVMKATKATDNEISYLVRHKMIVIGCIINEQY